LRSLSDDNAHGGEAGQGQLRCRDDRFGGGYGSGGLGAYLYGGD
jgi:hypothetical protein